MQLSQRKTALKKTLSNLYLKQQDYINADITTKQVTQFKIGLLIISLLKY